MASSSLNKDKCDVCKGLIMTQIKVLNLHIITNTNIILGMAV